jgi:hypothetical protein
MYSFVGRHSDQLAAVLAATIAIVGGLYLAWFGEPVWLNRAGALVVAIGVILGASRFPERMQYQVQQYMDANRDAIVDQAVLDVEGLPRGRPISDEERRRIAGNAGRIIARRFDVARVRIKALEVYLVVGGTLLSGFGDWLVSMLK